MCNERISEQASMWYVNSCCGGVIMGYCLDVIIGYCCDVSKGVVLSLCLLAYNLLLTGELSFSS